VRIAVAPGEYTVRVRQGDRIARCEIATAGAAATALDMTRCSSEAVVVATRKGGLRWDHPLRLEVEIVGGGERNDEYIQTLKDFGYLDGGGTTGVSFVGLRRVHHYLWVGAGVNLAGSSTWRRPGETRDLEYSWSTSTLYGIAHAEYPLGDDGFASRFALFARAGLGLGTAATHHEAEMDEVLNERYYGAAALVGAGIHTGYAENGGFGFTLGYQGEYAPIIENNFGQTHASGGHRIAIGFTYGF
jgi:hypothetical protein